MPILTPTDTLIRESNLINGEWPGISGPAIAVINPATHATVAHVPNSGTDECQRCIQAAATAFTTWKTTSSHTRARLLNALAEAMMTNQAALAEIMTLEQGKPLKESRSEIAYAASFLTWAAEEGKRLYGDIIPAATSDKRLFALRQPIGVVGCITPWNFPAAMITRKIGPALAVGCTTIIKPSRETPLSALAIGVLADRVGFPAGTINIITGNSAPIVDTLCDSPLVGKLSFTGSTEIGQQLMAKAAGTTKRISLELGGHAPFIVFDDANLEAAVSGLIASKYRNAGQTCICPNRVFVQSGIYDTFLPALQQAVHQLKTGEGMTDGVQVGPLIHSRAVQKVLDHISDATAKGATCLEGGIQITPGPGLTNQFVTPAILENCTADMLVFSEETFGPITPIRKFHTEADVIRQANDTPYGLASYFYTQDGARIMRVAEQLEYGIVGVNDGSPSTAQVPFGGWKTSGLGAEGGKYVMDEYTNLKTISWKTGA